MMTIIELDAYVTKDGELRLKLPPNIPAGHFRLRLELVPTEEQITSDDVEWTDEELDEALKFNPVPAKEIVTGVE
jgi:hypothetical protein